MQKEPIKIKTRKCTNVHNQYFLLNARNFKKIMKFCEKCTWYDKEEGFCDKTLEPVCAELCQRDCPMNHWELVPEREVF